MDPIRLAIQQPVTVTVGVILVLLSGLLAVTRLPIALTPNVETTVITVNTYWEGASPEEIELNIVDKQEERLLGLSNLHLMTSSSRQGSGSIRLEFIIGTDKNAALLEVSKKLDEVPDYPENVDNPVIDATDAENRDYVAWIVFGTTDPDFDVRILRDFAVNRIEPALERIPGVSEINVLGGREREIQIRVDLVRLAQYGITLTEFVTVIQQANRTISGGQRAEGKSDVRLRMVGRYESVDEVERTVIGRGESGGPIHLGDVATVVDTYKEPTSFVRSKGNAVIAINVEREPGSNVMKVMEGIKAEIARLNEPDGLLDSEAASLGLNGTLRLEQVYDQTVYIEDALALVRSNIWIGGGLAVLVLILFLRSIRSVGIIAFAIPISVIGAVVAMVAMGRSINVISLAGMAFAVGMVVDNAIVVLENIFRHLEMGKSPHDAAYHGTREVWGAILASTLTTIAVFVPILLIQEEAGLLFRDIALAICAAVGLSLLVSITVIPTAAARILRPRGDRKVARAAEGGRLARWLGDFIYAACGRVSVRIGLILLLTGISVIGTLALLPPADYLPQGNRNLVMGFIIPPPGYNIAQYEDMATRVEETIRPYFEAGMLIDDPEAYEKAVADLPPVPTDFERRDRLGDTIVPPTIDNYFMVAFDGMMFHGAVSQSPKRVAELLSLFQHSTRGDVIPGVFAFSIQIPLFQLGGSTGSAVKLQLAGPDLDEVIVVAKKIMWDLMQSESFQMPKPTPGNFSVEAPEIEVRPDLVRLSEIGLNTIDVGLAVSASGDGAIIGEYQFGGESIDLKVISTDAIDQDTIEGLLDLPLATRDGSVVHLGSVASIRRVTGPEEIARVGRQRAVTFELTPHPDVSLETAIEEVITIVAAARERGDIPPRVQHTLAGTASKLEAVRSALLGDGTLVGTLFSSLSLALLVVYLLMCVLFQGFLRPLVIMFSVPLATLGGFAALYVVHEWSLADPYTPVQKLDVLTMLGFILLIGVVVNNAILIVHQTANFMTGKAETGTAMTGQMTPRRAIAEAVRTRARPIFMSMLTSVGGMMPLVLMPGSGSELYRGLGSVVVGGLLVSTIFTLLLVPLLLSLVMDISTRRVKPATEPSRSHAAEKPGETAAAAPAAAAE